MYYVFGIKEGNKVTIIQVYIMKKQFFRISFQPDRLEIKLFSSIVLISVPSRYIPSLPSLINTMKHMPSPHLPDGVVAFGILKQ